MPIDPQVKALTQAIGEAETGPTSPQAYTQKGKSGEFGRYQFMPDTYKAYATKYLGDGNAQPTIDNQNKIAYSFVKEKKDAGYNPAQIASMWNAGEGKPNAYKENYRGVNSEGVAYDTPAYAQKVSQYYEKNKAQIVGGPNMGAPTVVQPQNPSFVDDVSNTITKAGTGVADAYSRTAQGQINPISGVIQGAGALAGGVGDLTTNVLEHTPIVGPLFKGAEGLIGQGAQALANTDTGQNVVHGYQDFAQAHPELASDLGSALNIASAVPLFKGLGLVKNAAKDISGAVFKNSITENAGNELKGSLTTKGSIGSLDRAEARGLDPVKVITSEKSYLPDVVHDNGKFVYDTTNASKALEDNIGLDENTLQEMLNQGVKKNIGVDLNQVRAKVLKDVSKTYSMSGNFRPAVKAVNDYFDSFLDSTGGRKIISLNELNGIKRDVRNSVFNIGGDIRGSTAAEVKYNMGQSLMKQVEDIAKQAGVKGVGDLNKIMGAKIEAAKLLKAISGKTIKSKGGLGREMATDVAGGLGEAAGNAIGVPLAGTFAGRGLAGFIGRRLPKTSVGRLKGLNPPTNTLRKGLLNLGAGLAGQKASQSQTQ